MCALKGEGARGSERQSKRNLRHKCTAPGGKLLVGELQVQGGVAFGGGRDGGPAVFKAPQEVGPDTMSQSGTLGSGRARFDRQPYSLLTVIFLGLTSTICSDVGF